MTRDIITILGTTFEIIPPQTQLGFINSLDKWGTSDGFLAVFAYNSREEAIAAATKAAKSRLVDTHNDHPTLFD